MQQHLIRGILSLGRNGLSVISNPSDDHPDNALYCEMEKMGLVIAMRIEEGGIIAVKLTSYGQKLQKKLRETNPVSQ